MATGSPAFPQCRLARGLTVRNVPLDGAAASLPSVNPLRRPGPIPLTRRTVPERGRFARPVAVPSYEGGAPMKVSLVVASGAHQGKVIPITGLQFLIGRDAGCQLRPASQAISKKHCGVLIRDGKVYIKDFNS